MTGVSALQTAWLRSCHEFSNARLPLLQCDAKETTDNAKPCASGTIPVSPLKSLESFLLCDTTCPNHGRADGPHKSCGFASSIPASSWHSYDQ